MNRYELAGKELENEYHITVSKYCSNLSGRAYHTTQSIIAPRPTTAKSFAIFAHEVGHIANGVVKPSCLSEYKAEMFTIDCFKRFGFKMPRIVANRIKWYICYSLAQALNRGIKNIPEELKPYRKFLIKHRQAFIHGNGKITHKFRYYADNRLYYKS
jgi:hypothetical protein